VSHSVSHTTRGVAILTGTTFIWGTTFVVTKRSLNGQFPASTLVFARFLVAGVIFLPFLRRGRKLWLAAIELGVLLWLGFALQTIGLRYTSATRSAFLTSMHVILVPAFSGLLGRSARPLIWLAAAMALLGCGLLSHDGSPPNIGDLWTAMCAVTWAIYIARLEAFAQALPSKQLTAAHLWVVVALGAVWVWQAHEPIGGNVPWFAIFYLGIAATAGTTWLQTVGQRWVSAPQAAVLYTLEPVWAAVFAWIILHERLGPRGWIGATLILSAAALTALPVSRDAAHHVSPGEAGG
jgi:drug/metabolite transporter (DMT)-like permease